MAGKSGFGRIAVLAVTVLLAACEPGVLNPAGPVAAGERTVLLNSLVIMLGIVIPTIIATLAFAWWFRAGNTRATYLPTWTYSGRVELLVWSVPALVVIFLAGITWIGSHDLAPEKPLASKVAPIEVQVVALDWKWLFIYPGQNVATVNRLVIPVGTPIRFRITSGTVMNSFFVPQLGSQIYAMSGMDSRLHLQADQPGRYRGMSAHYSGEGFADMNFVVDAVAPAQFAGWVAQTRGTGPLLDGPGFAKLASEASSVKAPFSYRAVLPGLYDRIVAHAVTPAQFASWVAQTRGTGPLLDGPGFAKLASEASSVKAPFSYRAVLPGLYDRIVAHAGAAVRDTADSGREDKK